MPVAAELTDLTRAITSTLEGLSGEERFLLSSYFLDRQPLAQLARVLHVHEATISRRLKRLLTDLRKRLLHHLQAGGLSKRAAEEALGNDPRDLEINLRALLQSSQTSSFSEQTAAERRCRIQATMSELFQAGQHPDADQLNAFVERTLPAHEQQQTLAHLALCPHCRQIVALSLPPADESPILPPEPVRHRWWAWAGIPALAAIVLVIVFVRHEQRNVRYTSVLSQMADARKPAPPPAEIRPPQHIVPTCA